MTFLNIDSSRFKYLLSLGMDDFELRAFFRDCRLALIMQGAKVQNLPHGRRASIDALACQLPSGTEKVIRQWFAKNVTMVDPADADEVVTAFTTIENGGEPLSEALARRYSRSCLVHLFRDPPPHGLVQFLRTPIGASGTVDPAYSEAAAEPEATAVEGYPESLPLLLLDLVEGREVQEHLDGVPVGLGAFIAGIRAVVSGDVGEIQSALEALVDHLPLRAHLEQFARQHEAKGVVRDHHPRGLDIVEFAEYGGSYDSKVDAMLGYCTNDRAGATFVRPIAVVRGNQLERLAESTRKELFPDTGDVIAFVGPNRPKAPRRGQIGVWQVAEHDTEKLTHFHLQSEKRPVFEVRLVPFASTDYDSVREFLKSEAERAASSWLQPSLFLLQDGVMIGGRTERPDLTKDQTFESGLVHWNALTGFRFEGRSFVLGPTRKGDGIYECASLAFTARKLFRGTSVNPEGSGRALTKAQLRDLVQSLDSHSADLDLHRVQRIKAELDHIGDLQEAMESVVAALMTHQDVKSQIDQRVDERVATILASKASLQDEIATLQRERLNLERSVRKQAEELRKLREDTGRVVKEAFDRASKNGLATLADIAVFRALSTSPVQVQQGDGGPGKASDAVIRDVKSSTGDLRSILRTYGVPSQRATAFAALGECAIRCGLMVGVSGFASRTIASNWAGALSSAGALIDATVGLISDIEIGDLLQRKSRPDVIALLDANLSALDIYARPLTDLVLDRAAKQSDVAPAVLFSVNGGVGSLPIPVGFERLSVMLDLDAPYAPGNESELLDLRLRVTDPQDGSLYKKLWRPAGDKLVAEIQRLAPDTEALVLSIFSGTGT